MVGCCSFPCLQLGTACCVEGPGEETAMLSPASAVSFLLTSWGTSVAAQGHIPLVLPSPDLCKGPSCRAIRSAACQVQQGFLLLYEVQRALVLPKLYWRPCCVLYAEVAWRAKAESLQAAEG